MVYYNLNTVNTGVLHTYEGCADDAADEAGGEVGRPDKNPGGPAVRNSVLGDAKDEVGDGERGGRGAGIRRRRGSGGWHRGRLVHTARAQESAGVVQEAADLTQRLSCEAIH